MPDRCDEEKWHMGATAQAVCCQLGPLLDSLSMSALIVMVALAWQLMLFGVGL